MNSNFSSIGAGRIYQLRYSVILFAVPVINPVGGIAGQVIDAQGIRDKAINRKSTAYASFGVIAPIVQTAIVSRECHILATITGCILALSFSRQVYRIAIQLAEPTTIIFGFLPAFYGRWEVGGEILLL